LPVADMSFDALLPAFPLRDLNQLAIPPDRVADFSLGAS
jgi:hypothetical protein